MSPVTSAAIAAVVSLVVSTISALSTFKLQERRLRTELQTEFMAEQAIHVLLWADKWRLRSLSVIRDHVGGFTDDELRQLLVRAGALRFKGGQEEELWGLRERNLDRLA